ncbi:hypothetical protein AKJ18_32085, partial [Vibrio xuii]
LFLLGVIRWFDRGISEGNSEGERKCIGCYWGRMKRKRLNLSADLASSVRHGMPVILGLVRE